MSDTSNTVKTDIPTSKAIAEFLKMYVHSNRLSKNSAQTYGFAIQSFTDFVTANNLKTAPLSQITEKFQLYADYLVSHGKSGKSIQQYITIVKMLFRMYKLHVDYSYRLPVDERKENQMKRIRRWFSETEVDMCLNYNFDDTTDGSLKLRNKLIVRLCAETGARIQEIANIKIMDFNVNSNSVFLADSKTEPRTAFYSPATELLVDQCFGEEIRECKRLDDYAFPGVDHCKKIIQLMLEDLGIKQPKDGRGPHTFRHFVATHLYYNGKMKLNDLAVVLGDKPETIQNCYLHPTSDMLQQIVNVAWGWRQK